MNKLQNTMLVCCCLISAALADEIEPLSFESAREIGRKNSAFLHKASVDDSLSNAIPTADISVFQKTIGPILAKNCVACHGANRTEAQLRIDQLNPNLLAGPDIQKWLEVYEVLSNAEMPPADEADFRLTDSQRAAVVDWLSEEMNKASVVRKNNAAHSSFRRLTRYETGYALQDLLGLQYSLAEALPPESTSEDGFKNSSEMLQMSAKQFETYRAIAAKSLRHATVTGEQPKPVTYAIAMKSIMQTASGGKAKLFDVTDNNRKGQYIFDPKTGKGLNYKGGTFEPLAKGESTAAPNVSRVALIMPRSGSLKLNLGRFLPDEGIMRVRIRAGRSNMNANEHSSFRLIFGAHTSNNASFSQVISQRDVAVTASAETPEFVHFDIPLSEIPRNPFRHLSTPFPRRDEHLTIQHISNAHGNEPLTVSVDYVEITAPFYEQWPPTSHTDIFFASDNRHNEPEYCCEVLARFMRRAWRRPIASKEIESFVELFKSYRPEFATFEEAMVEVLASVLASPDFLYITQRHSPDESKGRRTLSDVELASRLSFFLWSSIPDEELLNLAEANKLSDTDVLHKQVERMVADPRSQRFTGHFVRQWLGLNGLNNVAHINDDSLLAAMQQEPIAFFDHVLKHNKSAIDFIHSDYAMVNERLAAHYKITGVFGPHFRKTPIDSQANRGGILTSAGIMAMNSNGEDSHPVKRGVWLLENILHDPPPPPPPNVPEVDLTDPDIVKLTLKEQIADHRSKSACVSCHAKIDPWGIVFENYDAMGAFRTKIENQPVDATSMLFNQQTLAGVNGLKRYLLTERQDQFARALVHKMTAYALGRPIGFGDRADIDQLTIVFRKNGDRLGDLVHSITQSKIFRSP